MSVLKLGSSGLAVESLQSDLNKLIGAGLVVDGQFGAHTFKAVEDYQTNNGLTVDGIVGPNTAASIAALLGGTVVVNPPGKLMGIDIYHGDDVNSWAAVVNGGVSFCYIKATDGLGHDPKYLEYILGGKAAGLVCGPYHFFESARDPLAQAEVFANTAVFGLEATDLPPCLDWEYADGHDPSHADIANAKIFLEKVAELTKRKPIIYMSAYMPEAINQAWLSDYAWWIAEYGVTKPKIGGWTIWQYDYQASVAGLNEGKAASDVNLYPGTMAEFRAWISKSVIT